MSVVVVGASHRSAQLEVRERLYFPPDDVAGALQRLLSRQEIREALVLSTCNRTEIVVQGEQDSDDVIAAVRGFLATERKFEEQELDGCLYVHREREAVRHLFRLGVGLDSMILGEPQILGQVKNAYHVAQEAGSLGPFLNSLIERSFSVAKKVRTESEIGRSPVSVSFAAVQLAQQIFGKLADKSVLILGAGDTAELTARHLTGGGVSSVFVVNRTFSRAQDLAREFEGEAVPYERLHDCLEKVDILISSTSAPHFVLRHDDARSIIKRRRNRPLFIIDIAVPRDIDPLVNEIDNIYLYDVDDLRHVADAGLERRKCAATDAERMVDAETDAFLSWCRSQEVAPVIVALREELHGLRQAELARFEGRLRGLDAAQQKLVVELTTTLINKVLHRPIRFLKRQAVSADDAGGVELVRRAFGLSDQADEDHDQPAKPEVRKREETG
jgi:glutamyl-tRNA reductase